MKEKLTRGDRWLLVDRGVEQVRKIEGEELITKFSIFDPKYPDDLREKWGRPAKIVEGNGFWIDLSKRKNKSMGFWHRNLDYDDLIFIVRGEVKWHTELGMYTSKEGNISIIPRGIAQRVEPDFRKGNYMAPEIKSGYIRRL